jgi:hypothetical protein
MPSENGTEELAKLRPAFKAQMMRNAMHDRTELDVRTVAILQKNGLLSKALPLPLPADTADILGNPDHPRRIDAPAGPFLFVDEGDTRQAVMRLPDYLLSHETDVRRAALKYFELLTASSPQVLTPKSRTAIERLSEDLYSTEPERWRPAAIGAVDHLSDDFLFNLAGVRQSLVVRYDAGVDQYLPLVLQPSVSSLDSINFRFPAPSTQREELRVFIEEIVSTSETLSNAIDRYYEISWSVLRCREVRMNRPPARL